MPVNPGVVIVASHMAAHARASGYDQLQYYLDAERIYPPEPWSLTQRAAARVLRFMIKRSGSMWYHRQHLMGELRAARRWIGSAGLVFHFLYGENGYRYLGVLKRIERGHKIICTYHTPPAKFTEVVKARAHLSRIDAAIVVSTMQLEFFGSLLGADRVHFVPHGIDTSYFQPGPWDGGDHDRLRCLFVGSHLRDMQTLAATAKLLESNGRVHFTVVTRPHNLAGFAGLKNVTGLSGVDDAELLALYQRSDLLVFPLLDCTANNSLLEAMACGLPAVTTDLQGVRDYVTADSAILTRKGDAHQIADVVLGLERDRERIRPMRDASRRRALEFGWEAVAGMTREIYRKVAT